MGSLTLRDVFIERYRPYNIPEGKYRAYPWSPELFVELIRMIVLRCSGYPMIRTKTSDGRRLVYRGTLAIYLICWGGDPACQTVVLYGVPEDLWMYMDASEGEWKRLYERFVRELYGELSDVDREVLSATLAGALEGLSD